MGLRACQSSLYPLLRGRLIPTSHLIFPSHSIRRPSTLPPILFQLHPQLKYVNGMSFKIITLLLLLSQIKLIIMASDPYVPTKHWSTYLCEVFAGLCSGFTVSPITVVIDKSVIEYTSGQGKL